VRTNFEYRVKSRCPADALSATAIGKTPPVAKEETMRAIFCLLLAGGLLMAFAGTGEAANGRAKQQRQNTYYYNSPTTATERQLRNQRAYERGEYYEHDSNALPFGSRAWWEQKQREGRDER
jgi:hypothetical protein